MVSPPLRASHLAADERGQTQTFSIFRDGSGMYRWVLTDPQGQRLMVSPFGSAALAGAFREVEALCAQDGYSGAVIRDETGR
jgi:hypothetical protein